MTQIHEEVAPCSVAAAEAKRIYAKQPPLTRAQVAEMMKARGWETGADGKPVFRPKA
jgi:hypothetical protein